MMDSYQQVQKWTNGKMSSRPEYYPGRGPNRGDCGPDHLKMLHSGIRADYGDEAAGRFADLIGSLADLSATNVLNQLYGFLARGCVAAAPMRESGFDVGPDDGTGAREVIGEISVLEIFARAGRTTLEAERWAHEGIKNEFLFSIGRQPSRDAADEEYAPDRSGLRFYRRPGGKASSWGW